MSLQARPGSSAQVALGCPRNCWLLQGSRTYSLGVKWVSPGSLLRSCMREVFFLVWMTSAWPGGSFFKLSACLGLPQARGETQGTSAQRKGKNGWKFPCPGMQKLGCNRSAKVGRASGSCTLQAGSTAAGKGLGPANLTQKFSFFIGLGLGFFSIMRINEESDMPV